MDIHPPKWGCFWSAPSPYKHIYILINRANSWQIWSLSICDLLVSTRPTQHSQVSPSADIMPMARCSFKTSTRRSSPLISGFPSQMLREWSTNGTFKHSNWWDMLQPLLVGLQILTCKIWRLAQWNPWVLPQKCRGHQPVVQRYTTLTHPPPQIACSSPVLEPGHTPATWESTVLVLKKLP